jgi:putative colanic acid biosynthesis UDP-glucose lipid carrier transferase
MQLKSWRKPTRYSFHKYQKFRMQTRYLYILRYFLPIVDLALINSVCLTAFYISAINGYQITLEMKSSYMIICNLAWVFSSTVSGLYLDRFNRKLEEIYHKTFRSMTCYLFLLLLYSLYAYGHNFPLKFILVYCLLLSLTFLLNRFAGTVLYYTFINHFSSLKKVAVIGRNRTSEKLIAHLRSKRSVEFYGQLDHEDDMYVQNGNAMPLRLIRQLKKATKKGVKILYVTIEPGRISEINALISEVENFCIRIHIIPDFGSIGHYNLSYLDGQFPMVSLRKEPLEDLGNRFKKRLVDIVVSSLVIIFILSWLYPLIGILIKLESKGPVLFKQLRSGRDDKPFYCFKFRSMYVNNECNSLQASRADNRITRTGRFLRASSLDEFPQFLNVFLGHMSIVGPRPHMLRHTLKYKALISQFMVRHFLKPGITGWAQVNGHRGETRFYGDMESRIRHDIWYLENWSGMLDLKIVFLTIICLVKGDEKAF